MRRGRDDAALNLLRVVEELAAGASNAPLLSELAFGYGMLGQTDEARRIFEELVNLSTEQIVSTTSWAWAYMGIGDYDDALQLMSEVALNPGLLRNPFGAHHIRRNFWFDPRLETPEWIEVRNKLKLI